MDVNACHAAKVVPETRDAGARSPRGLPQPFAAIIALTMKFILLTSPGRAFFSVALALGLLSSCRTLEQASVHGLNSGYYRLGMPGEIGQKVYVDVREEALAVYPSTGKTPDSVAVLTLYPAIPDSAVLREVRLSKRSLDLDATSILLKYRPGASGMQPQLTADFNLAFYAGWRFDRYILSSSRDPLGKPSNRIRSRGYDIGVFAGPGTTPVTPFTTRDRREVEYSGMIVQAGVAAFIESDVASFGLAAGYDHLMNSDRDVWIYTGKPWLGFIVGVALN